MPHEYEERKRRERVGPLNEARACHICNSSCRRRTGNAAANNGKMRKCPCFGVWKYALRVCEHCLEDDERTGRIRKCGFCGTVACDDECMDMIECTDLEEWNQAGCLECRSMESFHEMDLFRGFNPGVAPKCTRVCVECLDGITPWIDYRFKCRRFYCQKRLVPSDIIEMKKSRRSISSALAMLPDDALDSVMHYCDSVDLIHVYQTSSTLCRSAERVAQSIVKETRHLFPKGPVRYIDNDGKETPHVFYRKSFRDCYSRVLAVDGHKHPLRVPEDGHSWVAIVHHLERMAECSYYFSLQNLNSAARFLRKGGNLTFTKCCPNSQQQGVHGSQLFGGKGGGDDEGIGSLSAVSDNAMISGKHRIICRGYFPEAVSGNFPGSTCIGLVYRTESSSESITWFHQVSFSLMRIIGNIEIVLGIELDIENKSLHLFNISSEKKALPLTESWKLQDINGPLFWAAELGQDAVLDEEIQLSIRQCSESEWISLQRFRGLPERFRGLPSHRIPQLLM